MPSNSPCGFFTCPVHGMETGHGAAASAHRPRGLTVDIHCHVATPAAAVLMGPYFTPDKEPAVGFANPESRAINQRHQQGIAAELTTAAARIADMNRLGIDIQAISPAPLQYYYWAEPELGLAAARLINDNLADLAARHADRFVALGTVPMQAPALAVAELRRCVRELDMRGVEISTHVDGAELSEDRFRPFFAAAAELDILVFMHPIGFTQGERLREHYLTNLLGNPLESTIAVAHLIFGGVLDRHPGLKLCVAHGGGFLPTYHGRLDHAFRGRADCRKHITRPPSDYLKRLYFDTVVFDPAHLAHLVAQYGADHVLMGTDYPYDMAEPDPVGFVSTLDTLTPAARDLILGGNAARLLKLPNP